MRKLLTLTAAAALLVAFGFAGVANAGKPTDKVKHGDPAHFTSGFSAPFVADGGAEVSHSDGLGSNGDLDNDGNWGVTTGELPGNTADTFTGDEDGGVFTDETVCENAANDGFQTCTTILAARFDICVVGTGAEVLLANVAGTGLTDDLDIDATEADGIVAPAGDYQRPSLLIRLDDAADCNGNLEQESGTTVVID